MTYQTIPINVAGPTGTQRSRALSSQSTINFFHQVAPGGKSDITLQSWPGQKLDGAVTGVDRGQHIMAGVNYRVAGTTLWEVSNIGSHINRGTVLGLERCIFANDGVKMFIVNDGNVQNYSNATQTITTETDPDIVGAIAVDFLNNQFIYTFPNQFIISDVGDGSSASALNAAQAESQPDDLIRAYVFDQIVYMFGELTIEPWYNSGSGLPPFDRIDTQMMSIGLAGIHTVSHNDNFLYWLGDDRQVYQTTRGSAARRISSVAISHTFESFTTVDDAVGWTMTLEGQNFFVLTFPTENKTFAVNENLGLDGWIQLSGDTKEGRYNSTSHSYIYGKHLLADETNGNLYELDINTFDNNGEIIQRTRTMSSFHGGLLGAPGKRVQMSRLELIIEAGVGTISGQGEDPKIRIEASYDGGKSFAPGTWIRVGRLGETNIRAEWWNLRSFYDLIVRIVTTDPVSYTIMSGAIDIRLAGR